MTSDERSDPLAPPEGYGSKLGRVQHLASGRGRPPDWAEQPGSYEFDGKFEAQRATDTLCDFKTPKGTRCALQRTWHWVAGDEHEHIAPMDICDRHERLANAEIVRGVSFWCTVCGAQMHVEHRYPVAPDGTFGVDLGRCRPATGGIAQAQLDSIFGGSDG